MELINQIMIVIFYYLHFKETMFGFNLLMSLKLLIFKNLSQTIEHFLLILIFELIQLLILISL